MLYELEIQIGTVKNKVFLQGGFFPSTVVRRAHFHRHNYAELHLVSGGSARFQIDETTLELADGSMLVIPRDVFHECVFLEESAQHTAFQLDRELSRIAQYALPLGMAKDFMRQIEIACQTTDYERIAAYIALFCTYFDSSSHHRVQDISDYGFLIQEFFSRHYKENVHLEDLARELHLSERQTERLVLAHVGHTFREELTLTRLTVADQLIRHSEMSLSEIARYVGYESYAGFWKAKKKHLPPK